MLKTDGVTSDLFSCGIERGFDLGNSATLFSTAIFHFVAFLLRTGVAKFLFEHQNLRYF